MVDINSVFYCYPTTGYGDDLIPGGGEWAGEKANVPLALTKSQACPFPAWVTNESLGIIADESGVSYDDHQGRLRTIWSFNTSGTRAACVVGHRDAPWSDEHYTSSRYSVGGDFIYDCQEDYPGVVEVEFTVEVTGDGLGDFDFAVGLRQSLYSKTDKVCPVAVGYAIKDMGEVDRESLIMLDHQFYTDNPGMTIAPSPGSAFRRLLRQNIAVIASVQTQPPDSNQWVEIQRWLSYYNCFPSTDIAGEGWPNIPVGKYSPGIKDLPGTPQDTSLRNNMFSYTGKLVSLDLSSLSWCVAACILEYGYLYDSTEIIATGSWHGADATTIIVTVFGSEKNRESIGHPLLKQVSSDMFDLVHEYPALAEMTRIYMGATAGYAEYEPNNTDEAIITVTNGDGVAWTSAIENAYEDIGLFNSIKNNSTIFPSAQYVKSPAIFAYFDHFVPVVRPGYIWGDGGESYGSVWFDGYPYIAILNARVNFLILSPLNATYPTIKTHINGSWSIFAGPFFSITETQRLSESVPENYEQVIIDRIVLVDKKGNEHSTSHVAMVNLAYSKELTEEDYYFNIRRVDQEDSTGLQISPASDDPLPQGWFDIYYPGTLGIGWTYEGIGWAPSGLNYLKGRAAAEFSIGSGFMFTYPYPTYSQLATFPSPRMECMFHPGEL